MNSHKMNKHPGLAWSLWEPLSLQACIFIFSVNEVNLPLRKWKIHFSQPVGKSEKAKQRRKMIHSGEDSKNLTAQNTDDKTTGRSLCQSGFVLG